MRAPCCPHAVNGATSAIATSVGGTIASKRMEKWPQAARAADPKANKEGITKLKMKLSPGILTGLLGHYKDGGQRRWLSGRWPSTAKDDGS